MSTAISRPSVEGVLAELAARRRWRLPQIALAAVLVAFLAWCAEGANLRPKAVIEAVPVIAEYFARMAPPKWEFAEVLWKPAAETLYIALWGNVIALLIGLPLGVLAASNVTRSPVLRHSARAVLNLLRSISELIWAVFFVAAVGLGPFAGVLAIALHATGMLAKFCAEEVEGVDKGPIEAIAATGGSRMQVILFGIVPQVIPAFISYSIYRFDVSIRAATILGLVGAGGLGFSLIKTMKLFQYHETATCILVIFVLVFVSDWICSRLRSRIL